MIAFVAIAILGVVGWAVASSVVLNTKAIDNYSEGLNEDGMITNVRALDYVTLCDYKNISVSRSELEITDEEMQTQIKSLLQQHPDSFKTDKSIKIKDGDIIGLDYVGSIDGVEFQGGSTNGNGTTLAIGSHSYIDGFEDAIIGHNVGENFDIFVTFPEDYGNADLAGKDAKFNITINSVAVFDDEFVANNVPELATTVEGYKQYYKDAMFEKRLKKYLIDYLRDNSTVNDYPKDYLKIVKGQIKSSDMKAYEANKEYMGNSYTFESYIGMDKKEYEASLTTKAMETIDENLKFQAICEDAGITVSQENVNTLLDEYGYDSAYYASYETTYGKGFLYQTGMSYAIADYLLTVVIVTE